jgi:hypothetical protein
VDTLNGACHLPLLLAIVLLLRRWQLQFSRNFCLELVPLHDYQWVRDGLAGTPTEELHMWYDDAGRRFGKLIDTEGEKIEWYRGHSWQHI